MKSQIRILGIDDAPFKFEDETTAIIGVVCRTPSYIEAVLKREVMVDGADATLTVIEMVRQSRHADQLKLIMLDGVAFGGFNIIDIESVARQTGIPVLTLTRKRPDLVAMQRALKAKFDDWEQRWALIDRGELYEIPTAHKPLYAKFAGIDLKEACEFVERATIRGALPEPVRIAHIIASGITFGESYGRA